MSGTHLVVDGSNIATEGRSAPSLAQLDEAVRAFRAQHDAYERVSVIVDATFGHRVDKKERAEFEEAILAGELVTPPAGTIGRGDAFILQVARIAGADVLSNDSFQELHAEHPWLFEPGRLWGGKPVPEVGWVFVERAPVRGLTSRKAVQAAKRSRSTAKVPSLPSVPLLDGPIVPKSPPPGRARKKKAAVAAPVPDAATDEPSTTRRRRRSRGGGGNGGGGGGAAGSSRPAVNEQLPYARFVIDHPVGSTVSGVVDRFSSHGAYVVIGDATGYVPLRELGDPPPRSAKEILAAGDERDFVVLRFDPTNRGIDVVPAQMSPITTSRSGPGSAAADLEAAAAAVAADVTSIDAEEALVSPTAKKRPAARKAAKKATKKRATARKATARKTAARRAPARKTAAKRTAKRAPARKKAAAKRAPARKKAAAKRAPARKKAGAKRAPARKKAAARKRPAARKATRKR